MATTSDHIKLREYIHQVVNDPAYKKLSTIPLFSWPQIGLVLFSYACVFGGIYLYIAHDVTPWLLYPIFVFCIYPAITPLHDSTHKALSSSPFLNDILGTLAGNLLLPFANSIGYRYIHMTHHRYVGDKDLDPDELLVGIPTHYAPWGYLVLFVADFTWAYWLLVKVWKRTPVRLRWNIIGMLVANTFFHIAWFMSPYWYEYLIIFFIPNRLGIAYTAFAFAHVQHGDGEIWEDHPFQATYKIEGIAIFL